MMWKMGEYPGGRWMVFNRNLSVGYYRNLKN